MKNVRNMVVNIDGKTYRYECDERAYRAVNAMIDRMNKLEAANRKLECELTSTTEALMVTNDIYAGQLDKSHDQFYSIHELWERSHNELLKAQAMVAQLIEHISGKTVPEILSDMKTEEEKFKVVN
jgi:cell division protein ZapA (FtsZ GTPase activity inhibitor)